jgi:hypothetical protein
MMLYIRLNCIIIYDFVTGDSRTFSNQSNHNEAIVRGYLNSSIGVPSKFNTERENLVNSTLNTFYGQLLGTEATNWWNDY